MQHSLNNCATGFGVSRVSSNHLSGNHSNSSNNNVANMADSYDNIGPLPYLAKSQVGFLGAPLMHHHLQQQLQQQQRLHSFQQQQQHQHFHHIPHLVTSATTPPSTPGPQSQHQKQQSQPPRKKAKRIRTTFTPEQLKRLEYEFSQQMYLVGEYRSILAKKLGLTEGQVKVWFQNRRIKQRKQQDKI